ncbi:MAG: hypothetical protein JNL21_40695 [Myxococcales bacterium]|nr:hypothetical protein [Myxococcales bacterium]
MKEKVERKRGLLPLLVIFGFACREPSPQPPVADAVPSFSATASDLSAASTLPAKPSAPPAVFPLEIGSLATNASHIDVCRSTCRIPPSELRGTEHVRLFRFEGKATATIPGGQLDAFLLVLEGGATLQTASGTTRLETWRVARLVGQSAQVEGDDNAVILVALATDAPDLKDATRAAAPSASPETPSVVDLRSVPELVWAGGKSGARIAFESGRSSFGLIMMASEGEVPEHEHEGSVEALFGLSGAKWLYVAPKPNEPVDMLAQVQGILVDPGAFARAPRGHRHLGARFHGDAGKAPFIAVQMYVPPGPEQRFRALAEKEKASASPR